MLLMFREINIVYKLFLVLIKCGNSEVCFIISRN